MSAFLSFVSDIDYGKLLISAIDIALVALIIYRVLLLIRGTRAAYMLMGLLIVAGIYVGAHRLSLATLSWLLDHLISYLLLIVIIVFQGEIRRGLTRMGRRMFAPMRNKGDREVIEDVIRACKFMTDSRIGALVVIEREVDLKEFIQPGLYLDAVLSKDLLVNIFTPWPNNALHDGAVIIRGNRIVQANVVLPLSSNVHLDKSLGTRHRAGVGITEESDAVSIVVSEQRGTISLCTGGMIHVALPTPILRRYLLALLASEGPAQSRWQRWIANKGEQIFGRMDKDDTGRVKEATSSKHEGI